MRLIILDNGHGQDTKGKRSPVCADGSQLLEWKYTRKVVNEIYIRLQASGISCVKLVPEQTDTPLSERVRRANGIAAMNSISQVLLVSEHVNAAGGAGTASGWEIHTSPGRTKADEYAQYFWDAAYRILGDRFPIRGDTLTFISYAGLPVRPFLPRTFSWTTKKTAASFSRKKVSRK